MKKTIKKQDGSEEIIEGSPEEISDYEKKIKQGSQNEAPAPTKGPGLLTDEIKRLQDFSKIKWNVAPQHSPSCEKTVAATGWWSIRHPRCTCGAEPFDITPYTVWTYTSNTTDFVHTKHELGQKLR